MFRFGKDKKKERGRYYLLAGMGGRAARRKRRRVMWWTIATGLFFSALLGCLIYTLSRSGRP
jgi:hypothetical protein